jgi:hypothetical protein
MIVALYFLRKTMSLLSPFLSASWFPPTNLAYIVFVRGMMITDRSCSCYNTFFASGWIMDHDNRLIRDIFVVFFKNKLYKTQCFSWSLQCVSLLPATPNVKTSSVTCMWCITKMSYEKKGGKCERLVMILSMADDVVYSGVTICYIFDDIRNQFDN